MTGTLGDPQSLNRYAYVRNMPLGAIDPTGIFMVNCTYAENFNQEVDKGDGGPSGEDDSAPEPYISSCGGSTGGGWGPDEIPGWLWPDIYTAPCQDVVLDGVNMGNTCDNEGGDPQARGGSGGGGAGGLGNLPINSSPSRRSLPSLQPGLCPPSPYPFPGGSTAADVRQAQAVAAGNLAGANSGTGNPLVGAAAANVATSYWWYNQEIKTGSPWDYKNSLSPRGAYDAAGNFTFGAVGTALGYSPSELLNGAGAAKMFGLATRGSRDAARNGVPILIPPFGNQADKQREIAQGILYFFQMGNCIP